MKDPVVRETKTSLLRRNANLLKKLQDVEDEIVELGGKEALDLVEEAKIANQKLDRFKEVVHDEQDYISQSSKSIPMYKDLVKQ